MAITFLDEEEDIVATAEPQKGKSRITFLDEGTPVEAPVSERSKITFLDEELAVTARPEQPAPPVGTSLMAELAALPQALQQGIEQPTEAMGETATALGMPALGKTLRGAVEAPKDYVPAAQRFMEPQEGEFQIAGFAPQYLPRAAVEQSPQVIGTVLSGIGGRAIGGVLGLPLGPKGVVAGQVAGQFLGPALFEMGQIVGPVARERAANQGREEPNTDDLAWAWATAGASGALNAIGAKYLPFGDDIASGLAKSVSKAFAGEFTTEGAQAVVQQAGESFLTERGLDIKPKQALGEAIIGGVAGGGAAAVAAPFTPAVKAAAAAETKVVAEQAAPVAPETAQIVSEQANQVIAQAQAEETAETPEQRVARLQAEAQAAREITLEEQPPVAGLPPTPEVTQTAQARITEREGQAVTLPEEPTGNRVEAAAYQAPDGTVYYGPSHLDAMAKARDAGKIDQAAIDAKQETTSRETPEFGFATNAEPFVTRDQAETIARQSGQITVEQPATGKLHSNEVSLDAFAQPVTPAIELPPSIEEVAPEERENIVALPPAETLPETPTPEGQRWDTTPPSATLPKELESRNDIVNKLPELTTREAMWLDLSLHEVSNNLAEKSRTRKNWVDDLKENSRRKQPLLESLQTGERMTPEQAQEALAVIRESKQIHSDYATGKYRGSTARGNQQWHNAWLNKYNEIEAELISNYPELAAPEAAPAAVEPTPVTPPPVTPEAPATAESKFSQFIQPKERPDLAELPEFKSFEMEVRGVPVRFDIDTTKSDENTLYLESFRVPRGERRQGIGREVMTNVLRWADENNVTLKGEALTAPADRQYRTPQEMREQGYMTPRELFRFYQSLGWESDPEGPLKTMGIPMVYRPKPAATKLEVAKPELTTKQQEIERIKAQYGAKFDWTASAIARGYNFEPEEVATIPENYTKEIIGGREIAVGPVFRAEREQQRKLLAELNSIERAAISGRLVDEGIISKEDAYRYSYEATARGADAGRISNSEETANQKWDDKKAAYVAAGTVAGEVETPPVDHAAEEAERVKQPKVNSSTALDPDDLNGLTVREALLKLASMNFGASEYEASGRALTKDMTMQRVASALAKLPLRGLDAERVMTEGFRGTAQAFRASAGDIFIPKTDGKRKAYLSPSTLIHEVGHTLTLDAFNKYIKTSRGKSSSGERYYKELERSRFDKKTPEPVKKLISLYIEAIEQLGLRDVYFGKNGLADIDGPKSLKRARARAKKPINPITGKPFTSDQLYGLSNIDEFVSEIFSEPPFQDFIKTIPTKNGQTSIWKKFVEAIRELFGFPSKSIAEQVISATIETAALESETVFGRTMDKRLQDVADAKNKKIQQGIADQEKSKIKLSWKTSESDWGAQLYNTTYTLPKGNVVADKVSIEIEKDATGYGGYMISIEGLKDKKFVDLSKFVKAAYGIRSLKRAKEISIDTIYDISLATGRPAPTPEVREARREPAITPQQDRDYLDAVERGDLDAASRAVEDAAKPATHKFIDASVTQSQRIRWVASANKQINFWEAELKKIPTKSQATKEYQELVKAWNDAGLGRAPEDVIRGIMELKLQPPPATLEEYLKTRIDLQKIGVEKELEKAKEILSRTPAGQDQTQFKTGEPTVVKVYHSTPFGRLTEFSDEMLGAFTGAPSATRAHFFAGSPDVSETYYADSSWLLNHKGFFQLSPDQKKDLISSARESLPNGLESTSEEIAELAESLFDIANYNTDPVENVRHDVFVRLDNPLVYDFKGAGYREVSFNDLLIQAEQGGHDGVIMANTTDAGPAATIDSFPEPVNIVAVLRGHSNQIKLADPVTYDDQGNIIPLSQRFQPEQADIRYARTERDPEVQKAAQDLKAGIIDRDEYQRIVDMRMPLRKFEAVPIPATNDDMLRGLGERIIKRKDAAGNEVTIKKQDLIQAPESIAEGTVLESRLDIPAYENADVWVVSLHEPRPNINKGNAGPVVAYTPTSVLRNVEFGVTEQAAVNIAAGKQKTTIATMKGEFVPMTAEQAYELANTNKEQWVEIGMNPVRHSYFYDKDTQTPVVSAEEVVQVGGMVLAKNPVFGKREDYLYARRVQMGRAGMETSAVEARLQEIGFPTGGIIRVVNKPDADFEGRTIILDGKVTGIELNASALKDNAAIDRVLNHEFAESANADGALNKLVERLTPKEKKEINDTITRLRYEERARTSEEAARAIEALAEAWKGRGFFTRAVARVEAWASKLGFKLTRRAAEYIAARNLADINEGFRTAYNRFINVKGEAREGRAFVTPEENARFLELAKDTEANREELQKMVDSAAKRAGYNIRLFRGGVQDYNVFRTEKTPEGAAFFTDSPAVAQQFATERGARGRVKQFFIKASNPKTINFELIMEQIGPNEWVHSVEKMRFQIRSAKIERYDSLIIKNVPEDAGISTQYAIFNPEQIKSIDVIARDNQGNVIPLNERFQPTTPDIRYALKQKPVDSVFSPEAFRRVGEGFKSRSKIIRMSIDDFLKLATQLPREQSQEAQNAFDAGIKWDSIPNFETRTDENGVAKIIGHEGRHRALVLKRAGYTEMPVAIIDRAIRWAEQTDPQSYDYVENFPTQLEAERTKERIPFPFSREDGTVKYVPQTAEIRESRRKPEAIPTFTDGTPEAATLKEMATSMAKVDAASEAKGGKPETYKISEIASVWMDSGLGERELQDAIVEYTNLTPANAARVAKAIARQYDIQQSIATAMLETPAGLSVEALPEGVTLPKEVDPDRPKPVMQRLFETFMGVRVPTTKITVNEKTALKDQIRLKAAANRAAKDAQKATADAVVETIKQMELRGPVRPKQAQALAKRAVRVIWTSEKSVEAFTEYAAKVVENTNYDADVREAKAAQKRAKELSKQKTVAMSPQRQVLEDIGKISIGSIDDPRLFADTVNYYMRAFKKVTSPDYVVIPDSEMTSYLSQLENQEIDTNAERERVSNEKLAAQYGLPVSQVEALLNSQDIIRDLVAYAKREQIESILNQKIGDIQTALKAYDQNQLRPDQRKLVDSLLSIDANGLDAKEKQSLIRIGNNVIYNNQTNGAQYFVAVANGQQNARQAAQDFKTIEKNRAWIDLIPTLGSKRAAETMRNWSLELQSVADTFRNIFGKESMAKIFRQMGMYNLDRGFTDAANTLDQIQEKMAEFYKKNTQKYKKAARDQNGILSEGVVGFLIQQVPAKGEAESIAQRRDLIKQDIANRRSSQQADKIEMANRIEEILGKVDGNTVEEILANMKANYRPNYDSLTYLMNDLLPQYKDFLKQFDENFNDQANNYDNPYYLPIAFIRSGPELEITPESESMFYEGMSLRPRQAANTIKRVDYSVLPKDKSGNPKEIQFNLRRGTYDSLSDQINKAYTNEAWQQIFSFMKTADADAVFGGRANKDFMAERLNRLRISRMRRGSANNGAIAKFADSISVLARKIGTGIALGGVFQVFKQSPDQLISALGTTGRYDLLGEHVMTIGSAKKLLDKFSIGRRGDASSGYKYINQMEGAQNRLERAFTESRWSEVKENASKVADVWMLALKKTDFLFAASAWMTYYRANLDKNGIKFEGWDKEAQLVDTDPARQDAASYAEQMTDIYQGSSDPTKMATFAQSGKSGWENFVKAALVPFNSFAVQQRMRIYSDGRDSFTKAGETGALGRFGLASTIGGLIAFHSMRRLVLPTLTGLGVYAIYGMLGVDMDEPDEDKQKEEARKTWRQFQGELLANTLVGGAPQFVEAATIDAFNYANYLVSLQLESEDIIDDNGEIMDFAKYQKERSPFWRYQSFKNAPSFGMFDVGFEQAEKVAVQTKQLMDREQMEMYTPEEQRLLYFSTLSEWLYLMRLNDADLARMVGKARRDMIKAVEDREKEIKRIREGR